MLLRQISNVSCKLRTFISYRNISSKKMNDFYIRICEPEEKFNVTFDYKSEGLQVGRTFNMKRTVSEPASDFISRIKSNVAKVIDKKAKRKKTKDDSVPTPPEVNVQIYKEGKLIDESQPCKEVFFSGENGITVRINDCNYKVLTNPPWIDTLTIPSNLMVGSYAYPCKLEIIFGSISQSRFVWYKSNEMGGNWKEVTTNQNLFLTEDFLGCKIKLLCIPGDGVKTGPQVEALSNAAIKPGPTGLPFLERHKYTEKPLPQGSFRVVSYNLLADVYAETEAAVTELFPYCPPFARNIDYRKQLYIRELIGYNADIICLQECDVRIFKNDLKHVLENFEGEMTQKNGTVSEGIATFYSKKKFRLLDKKVLLFSNEIDTNPLFSNVWDKVKNCEPLKKNLKERSTVFQALVLESTETDNIVVVGNTHLYFHPLADHIRVIQGGMAVMFMEDIIKNIQNSGKKTTLIFCGDMNSTPDCGLYLLMTEKHAPSDLKDWSSAGPEEKIDNLEFTQPFEMKSAYGAPPFTNYTEKFSGCLDYIYYQADVLNLLQAVPLPEENVLKEHTALPSPKFPSDHISLVADFAWSKT